MVHDKYRDWPLPGTERSAIKIGQEISLEEKVLKDLEETRDDIEKLEILDSYAAYAQRSYRKAFAEASSFLVGQQLGAILEPVLLSRLPEVHTYPRPRVGKVK